MTAYSFTDNKGVKREIRVTFKTIFDVAERTGYDLLNPGVAKDGVILSNLLLTNPLAVVRVVAALIGEDEKTFLETFEPSSFPALEDAFWKAYQDFFVQVGLEWLAAAYRKELKDRETKAKAALAAFQNLPKQTFSESSPIPASKTGGKQPSGNSQVSPTPTGGKTVKSAPKSSARSTTPMSRGDKTSADPKTSTPTKSPKASARKKSS